MKQQAQVRAYFFLLVATLCWGLNANFSRLAVGEVSPMQVVTFRWLGVVLLMALFARGSILKDWKVLRHHLPFVIVMGAFGFTAFNALFYVAGHHTSAINIGILQGAVPIFVLLGGLVAFGHRITPLQYVGVLITLVGVVIVWGANWPVMKVGLLSMPPIWFAAARMTLGAATLLVLLAVLGRLKLPTRRDLPLVFTVGALQMAAFLVCVNFGLQHVEA